MRERADESEVNGWGWWPFFVGGILGPALGGILKRWLAAPAAAGLGSFVAWMLALWLFYRFNRVARGGVPLMVAASAAAALMTGLLAYFFPWS